MLIATAFIRVKIKYPSTDEWVNYNNKKEQMIAMYSNTDES